jgi:hypothetical protein
MDRDVVCMRDLAERYREIATDPVQEQRRDLWRRLNGLHADRPVILLRKMAFWELPEARCSCEDRFWQPYEYALRRALFVHELDDTIHEPWISVQATPRTSPNKFWGVRTGFRGQKDSHHAAQIDPPIRSPEDLDKLAMPEHAISEEATRDRAARVEDAIGDILPVHVDRGPVRGLRGSIAMPLGRLLGIEGLLWWMVDHPEALHRLSAFLRDGTLKCHREAEDAGDVTLADQANQAMTYSQKLEDPDPDSGPVTREQLWYFAAAQEAQGVSPAMFDEFVLQYQVPIVEKYGLISYGCCEDLTNHIDVLRQVPNLRRIAVAPAADAQRCAEQIGGHYVASYRPSPADMVAYGLDEGAVRRILRRDLEAFRANGVPVDITLKDVETIQGDAGRVRTFVRACRDIIDDLWG